MEREGAEADEEEKEGEEENYTIAKPAVVTEGTNERPASCFDLSTSLRRIDGWIDGLCCRLGPSLEDDRPADSISDFVNWRHRICCRLRPPIGKGIDKNATATLPLPEAEEGSGASHFWRRDLRRRRWQSPGSRPRRLRHL